VHSYQTVRLKHLVKPERLGRGGTLVESKPFDQRVVDKILLFLMKTDKFTTY